jgi:class 3 adenylate cyclase/pimeloyl-ACP methyl ester carboxylesterase
VRPPETRYLDVGSERIAYQVFGNGPTDALFLTPAWVSVDAQWEHVGILRIWRLAAERFRIAILDHRGFGMSDPIEESRIGDPALCVEDELAVLDALGMERVALLGENAGGINAIALAATRPERVERLALLNGRVVGQFHGWSPSDVAAMAEGARQAWGTGELMGMAPNFSDDRDFLARYERMGARPSAAAAYVRNLATVDVRPLLGRIEAPTLVACDFGAGRDETAITPELTDQIPDARFFEAESTTFHWGGGLLEESFAFLSGEAAGGARDLATVLFTDVVDSTRSVAAAGDREWRQTLDFLDDLVEARATRAGGRIVKQTGDGHVVEFARPSDAVRAGLAICKDAPTLGVQLRAGIHTGEVERRERGDLGGLSVHVAARVAAVAGPGELVVSRTVADLLGAAGHSLSDRGEHELKGVPGRWQLFTVAG